MAKNSIRDYSATASSNTDIQSVDIDEQCASSGINNAIREVMADIKDVSTGAVALESPEADSLTVTGDLTVDTNTLYVDSTNNRVGVGGSDTQLFNGVGGSMKLVVIGNDSATTIANNSDAGIAIVNTNQTAGNLAGLHFARADTDDSPNYAGASIVARFPDAQVTGQYPKGDLAFLTSTSANAAPSEKMRIAAAGDVLVKTADARIGSDVGSVEYGTSTANSVRFYSSDTEAMRIDSSGNVLVGTSSQIATNAHLQVLQNGNSSFAAHFRNDATTNSYGVGVDSQTGDNMYFYFNGIYKGRISTSSSGTSFVSASDYRLKENVTDITDATTRLKQLNPVRFNFIADADTTVDGFLAHEVQSVVPEAVTGTHDEVDDDGNPVYQGIDQSKLVPLLVKTIQELEARVAALENA